MLPENTILQGRYQILEPIGRGGMGAVYKALDLRLRAIVALKETLLTGEVVRRAFEREAQLLAGLRHPALPKVSDHFTEGEGQFLVMEFIQGADLGRLMAQREGPFPVADVLRWADSLLDALEYLHSHNPPIVHRDIKPQNMKLTERGEIILLDFGLAKGAAAQATRAMTTSSIFGYTPHYAPLEQIQGTGTDPRSDLYALAATLHHLLTGTPPPDALTRAAAKINEAADPLELASRLNPDVPEGVAMVLARAMAQKPDQRYPTAAAMKSALRIAAQGGKPTETLSEVTGKLPDPNATMVIVGAGETVAARGGAGAGATTVEANIGTTVTPAGRPASAAPSAPRRRAWLWPAIGGAAVGIVAIVALLSGIGGGGAAPTSVPTAPPPTSVPAAAVSTEAPTDTPAPTAAPLTNEQILQTAVVLQTAEADKRAAELATARALVNAVDGAQTQTAIALTPTATALPTETPTAAPPTAAPPTAARAPANTPIPRPTADPRAPTNTPRPTPAPAAPAGEVVSRGAGGQFRGSARRGTIDAAESGGGSCVQGRVTAADGSLFASFYVQVDRGGKTLPAKHFFDTGNYRICGLEAGEWGVAVYAYNDRSTSGAEQQAHQVILRLSGQPGEVFFVDFQANFVPDPPTPTPTTEPPTPTPEPSPYDGVWRGTNSGETTTGPYPPGRFEIEVRNGAIYRISVDGPSCPFETYPNFPNGIKINGNSFGVSGGVFNPITGGNSSHTFSVSGTFVSTSVANGTLSAQLNGAPCANATWSAQK